MYVFISILKVQVNGPLSKTKRGGSKPEYLEKKPNNQPKNRYHILEVKLHHPNREWNPRNLTLVISSLGQNTHTGFNHLSYWLTPSVCFSPKLGPVLGWATKAV